MSPLLVLKVFYGWIQKNLIIKMPEFLPVACMVRSVHSSSAMVILRMMFMQLTLTVCFTK